MNVEHINPVYKATKRVFMNMLQLDVKKGELRIEKDIIPTKELNVSIGTSGDLTGTIMFSFSGETALKIVENMAGMQVDRIDKFVSSAIGELANIISGDAMTYFSGEGYNCDITPPQVNLGNNKTHFTAAKEVLVIPMDTEFGEFELNLSIGARR